MSEEFFFRIKSNRHSNIIEKYKTTLIIGCDLVNAFFFSNKTLINKGENFTH